MLPKSWFTSRFVDICLDYIGLESSRRACTIILSAFVKFEFDARVFYALMRGLETYDGSDLNMHALIGIFELVSTRKLNLDESSQKVIFESVATLTEYK